MPFAPARELVSGPDVGGGYLLQLSRDREPEVPGFTYHLQEGGIDAARPASAPVDWLGFARPSQPCMFGGKDCWERAFISPGEAATHVRNQYNRFRFVLGPILGQRSGQQSVPADSGLLDLLDRVAGPLVQTGVPWRVDSGTAAALTGGAHQLRAIRIETTADGCFQLGELLSDFGLWPVQVPPAGRESARPYGAAFLGTLVEGVLVLWSTPEVETGKDTASGTISSRTLSWKGRMVPIPG